MEAIVAVAVLAVVGVLAVRFGADSRDGLGSKDRELATNGVTWAERVGGGASAGELPAASAGPAAGRPLAGPQRRVDAILGGPTNAGLAGTGAARP